MMSSGANARRASKQTNNANAAPLLPPQQQYYSPVGLSSQPYQFQAPHPFPHFHPQAQLQQPQHLQHHHHHQQQHPLSPPQPPYQHPPPPPAQQPQPLSHNQQILSPLTAHPQQATTSPTRKRKATSSNAQTLDHALVSLSPTITSQQASGGISLDHNTGLGRSPIEPQLGDEAAANPVPKKNRTNTPWSPAEEHRLRQMRDAGKSWSEIAKVWRPPVPGEGDDPTGATSQQHFPARTEGSVKKHWYKDMHYADFAEDDSQALLNAIKEYEASKWKIIGQKVGKPAKACEAYAKEHFQGKI